MAEVTPEVTEEVKNILSNPTKENVEKYPDLFKKAEDLGIIKRIDGSMGGTPDPVLLAIQARYGDNYKSVDEFMGEVDKLKAGDGNMEFLRILPAPIVEAIEKFTKNEAWEEVFNRGTVIDYRKDYTDNELINWKYPGKFTAEELSDPANVEVQAAKKAAKGAFLIEKQENANNIQLAATRREQAAKKAKESLEASIADWKKKIVLLHPNIKPEQIAVMEGRMRSELTTGSFYSKFVNKDGTFHVEAASNLYPLAYFQDFTGAWMERGKIAAEKSTHEILDNGGKAKVFNRTPETPKADNGKKMLDDMFAGGKKKATYSLNKDN